MAEKGSLYLIPLPLSSDGLPATAHVAAPVIRHIRHFVVENLRTSRRFLRSVDPCFPIDDCTFHEMDKHAGYLFDRNFLEVALQGKDIGLMSEAGCPAIADPGHQVVAAAHQMGLRVVPLPGPNAMIMALMASGFNGQSFAFHGYLPIDASARRRALIDMERMALAGVPQIFMETPFRNNQLLEDLLKWLQPTTSLCIAANITASNEMIRTKSMAQWAQNRPQLHKMPAVFIIGSKK